MIPGRLSRLCWTSKAASNSFWSTIFASFSPPVVKKIAESKRRVDASSAGCNVHTTTQALEPRISYIFAFELSLPSRVAFSAPTLSDICRSQQATLTPLSCICNSQEATHGDLKKSTKKCRIFFLTWRCPSFNVEWVLAVLQATKRERITSGVRGWMPCKASHHPGARDQQAR